MKKSKRAALVLCLTLLLSALGAAAEGAQGRAPIEITVKKGSYITLGSYMGEPIVWRCVGEDENGMLMISRDILCYKSFSYGVNRWDQSFLRTWLNSADVRVQWEAYVPDAEHTDSNAYADEPGFLTGFSAAELALVKTVVNKSVVNQSQAAYASVGNAIHIYSSNGVLSETEQNYDDALGVLTEDRVFCPNIKQLALLGENYISDLIASPRPSALEQSGNAKNSESRSSNHYWLRDNLGNLEFPMVARCVYPNGRIFFSDVEDGSMGVRPALYIDKEQTAIDGKGYEAAPYVLAEPGQSFAVAKGSADAEQVRYTAYGAYSSITEGDYVVLGNLYGADIVWRCIDVNSNGPLLISDRILTFRAFDAAGPHGNDQRNRWGSNNWENSTLRHWLNSSEPEGDKQWPAGNPPNSESTGGSNGYSREKGFLTNFMPEELACIKPVTNMSVTNVLDVNENTVGTEVMAMRRNINNVANTDTALSALTWDTVFIPDIDEARIIKSEFGVDFLAMPTPEALNLNEAEIANQSADMTASWWLRDADGLPADPYGVRVITQDGWVDRADAYSPEIGVRPAVYLNMDAAAFASGDGSYASPYRVAGHSFGEAFVAVEPTCTEQGTLRRICAVCGEASDEPIPVLGHSFTIENVRNSGLFTYIERTCERCGTVHRQRRASPLAAVIGVALLAAAAAWAFVRCKKR